MSEKEYLDNYSIHNYDTPLMTVDTAIFSIINNQLNVLLVNRNEYPAKGQKALPGGFIDIHKDKQLDDAAYRKLEEKTGIKSPYLEQIETIGSPSRDPRGWSTTVLYFSLINKIQDVPPKGSQDAFWAPIKNIPSLAFDHNHLIKLALARLHAKVTYTALPIELLPTEFTLTELQKVYEIILQRKLPTKSFRRRIEAANIIENTGRSKVSGKRTAQLFTSNGAGRHYIFSRAIAE